MSNKRNKLGFTLIELLVVISIISILSVVGMAVFSGVTAKARDAQRKNDLKNLALALELYSRKNNGYPLLYSCSVTAEFYSELSGNLGNTDLPKDPSTKNNYCFLAGTQNYYKLYAKLENCSDPEMITGACNATWNYGIDSNGEVLKTGPTP